MKPITAHTPATATAAIEADAHDLRHLDLSANAVLSLNLPKLLPPLFRALANNTHLTSLNLANVGIADVSDLAAALPTQRSLAVLNLDKNRIANDGAIALADALAQNRHLMLLSLANQTASSRLGDATLKAFLAMFDTNVTLLKIVWRLESRDSFALTKKLTRNNEIDRQVAAGRDYSSLLPEGAVALDDDLVRFRAECAHLVSTPRSSRASEGSDEPRLERGLSQGREAPLPPPPPPPGGPSPPRVPLSANARARLDALDADERDALAAVRADYAARRDALRAELEAAANEGAP